MDEKNQPTIENLLIVGGIGLLTIILGTYIGYVIGLIVIPDHVFIPLPFFIACWVPLIFSALGIPLLFVGTFVYRSKISKNPAQMKRIQVFTILEYFIAGIIFARYLFQSFAM